MLTVIGTRPEAVKMAPVVLELRRRGVQQALCATSQHREMLAAALNVFSLTREYDLDVMRPDQGLVPLTARLLEGVDGVIADFRPDIVLVQGDTATCLAGALSAFYRRTPAGHVEAGLRTGDLERPFPEEGNRQMVSRIASLHFAPTEAAAARLRAEALPRPDIHVTGNTVIDALHMALDIVRRDPQAHGAEGFPAGRLQAARPYILVTGHRRESFGGQFRQICAALLRLARSHRELDIIYPVHLNPHVQEPVRGMLSGEENILLLPPQGYLAFTRLLSQCLFVLTDSGGIQEEASALDKPVLVMRTATERPEGLAAGTSLLVGTATESIVAGAERLLADRELYRAMAAAENPYGDGQAARRICDIICGATHA